MYIQRPKLLRIFYKKFLLKVSNISMRPFSFFSQIDQIRFRKMFFDNSAVEEKIIKNIIETPRLCNILFL